MAINPQYKVNKMAKDLGLKSKDLSDILANVGKDVKTQRTLEPVEFDILFETLTRKNQITNIEDYLDGVTKIPTKEKKEAQPAKEAEPKAGRSPGEWNGNPLYYSCLEKSMDRGAWWATVHTVEKSQT